MFLTQPPCGHVRVQLSGDYEGCLGGYGAVIDDFAVSDPDGVRLGQVMAVIKKRLQPVLESGDVYLDDVKVFVRNAVEVMEGDEREVEERTKARDGEE